MMTIGDYPEYLALGYPPEPEHAEVRRTWSPRSNITTICRSSWCAPSITPTSSKKLKKRTQDLRPAHRARPFGDLMEAVESVRAAEGRIAHLLALPDDARDQHHALALSGGRRDPTAACCARKARRSATTEDVGRHNNRGRQDRGLDLSPRRRSRRQDPSYTTGRLTSEMVIKTVRMGIPILVSRLGFYSVGASIWRGRSD